MSFYLNAVPEEDLVIAILNKMKALSFARIRMANKGVNNFVEEKQARMKVRANGTFELGPTMIPDPIVSGFVLGTVTLTGDGWNLRHQKSINAKLDYYRQLFINWPGRVVKLAVCTRCSYLHTLQVQTLIMSQEMTIFEKYLPTLELLISNGLLSIFYSGVARKILFKELEDRPAKTVEQDTLLQLLVHWWYATIPQLKIIQADSIEATSDTLESLAEKICPFEGKITVVHRTNIWNGQRIHVTQMTKFDRTRSAIAALWHDGPEAERKFRCKVYFDPDRNLTPEMLNPEAIYNE